MKKRWIATGVAATAVLACAGMVFASSDGYETYKDALKNMATVKSGQVKLTMQVDDNGQRVIFGTGTVKGDHEAKTFSGQMDVDTAVGDKSFEFYENQGTVAVHELGGEVWKTGPAKMGAGCGHGNAMKDPQQMQNMERIADVLLTGVKNQVQMEAGTDGGSVVKLDLAEGNVPEIVNTLVSMKAGHHGHNGAAGMNGAECTEMAKLKDLAPELVTDVKVKELHMSAALTADRMIASQSLDMTVEGKDANGTAHVRHIQGKMDLNGLNSTTPDTVNLEGKKTEPLNCGK